jgi:hypothetical protein
MTMTTDVVSHQRPGDELRGEGVLIETIGDWRPRTSSIADTQRE